MEYLLVMSLSGEGAAVPLSDLLTSDAKQIQNSGVVAASIGKGGCFVLLDSASVLEEVVRQNGSTNGTQAAA